MRRGGWLWFLALAACGSSASEASGVPATSSTTEAIVSGAADTTHGAVVTVISEATGTDVAICTGTIVQVDVAAGTGWVATAAHCVSEGPPRVVYEGTSYDSPSRIRHGVVDYAADARFDIDHPTNGYDYAVVQIDHVTATTPFIPLSTVPDGVDVGTTIENVGFGRTTRPPAEIDDNTERRIVTKQVNGVSSGLISYDSSASGACQGDSGGPWLVGSGANMRVVGIDSYGNQQCNGNAVAARVQLGLDFFAAHLGLERPDDCGFCKVVAESSGGACAKKEGGALATCECSDACAAQCAADAACASAPKCALTSTDACGTCGDGACCAAEVACADDATCASCLDGADVNEACASNKARKALDTCLRGSCSSPCATKLLASNAPAANADSETPADATRKSGCNAAGGAGFDGLSVLGVGAVLVRLRRRRRGECR